jgi:ribosomal protein S18 acetylase RimI-like enzyme
VPEDAARPTPALSLRPMTAAEFGAWRRSVVEAFAAEQVEAGAWTPDEALERAGRSDAALLPEGFATPGMLFFHGVRPGGDAVGLVWIGLDHPLGTPDCAFLYEIEIADEHRGAGYGRALLAAAEEVVRERGVGALELNVLGGNTRAIRLYESSGYTVAAQRMRKALSR